MSAKEGKTVGIYFLGTISSIKNLLFMGGGKKQAVGSEGGGKVACGSKD